MKIVLVLALSSNLSNLYAGMIFGAAANGNWNSAATWTPSGTPGAPDDVYIGSNNPVGAAATAAVTLTQLQAANNLYLGFNDSSGQGTLDLGNSILTIGNSLNIGTGSGSTGIVLRGTGSLTAPTLNIAGNSLTFGTPDVVANLNLSGSSNVTTTAAGNVTGSVKVFTGSTLNMGANMTLSSSASMQLSDNSTLNMNGHTLTGHMMYLGTGDGLPTTLQNRGALTATTLSVFDQTFNLNAADKVTYYSLQHATSTLNSLVSVSALDVENSSNATTTAAGNVKDSVAVLYGGTLNMGADMTLSGGMQVDASSTLNSTLNMNGHTLTANGICLGCANGTPTTLLNRGTLTTTNLKVGNQTFDLSAADTVTNYSLTNATRTLNSSVSSLQATNGSNATTTAAGNVTGNVQVFTSSTLNMGADMTLSGACLACPPNAMDVRDNSTLNMNGHTLTANTINLGYVDGLPTTLLNRGALNATNLNVGNQTFNLNAADMVTNYSLTNATSRVAGNVTGNVNVFTTSTLSLDANLTLSGTMDVRDNSTLDMAGHTLTAAGFIDLGFFGGKLTTLLNRAALTAGVLQVGNQTFNLNADDTVTGYHLTNATSTLNSSVVFLEAANGSNATTTAAGNVTGDAQVLGCLSGFPFSTQFCAPSTLTLGANMTLSAGLFSGGTMDVEDNSTLDMAGHSLTADTFWVGYFDPIPASGIPANVINDGGIQTNNFYLGNGSSMTMHPGDLVNILLSITGKSTLVVQGNGQLTGLTLNGNAIGDLRVLDTSHLVLDFGTQALPGWFFRWKDPSGGGNWASTLATLISENRIVISAPNGYSILDQNGYTYIEGGVASVPESASAALIGSGILTLAVIRILRHRVGTSPLAAFVR